MKGAAGTIIVALIVFGIVYFVCSRPGRIVDEEYRIGSVGSGTKYRFKFENRLRVPLRIINIQFACSCVSSLKELQGDGVVLAPGERFEVPLIFHPSGKFSEVSVPVLIETDSKRYRMLRTKLVGSVQPELRNSFVRASHRALLLKNGEIRNIVFESERPLAVATISSDSEWLRHIEEQGWIRLWTVGNVKGGQRATLKVVVNSGEEFSQFEIPVITF